MPELYLSKWLSNSETCNYPMTCQLANWWRYRYSSIANYTPYPDISRSMGHWASHPLEENPLSSPSCAFFFQQFCQIQQVILAVGDSLFCIGNFGDEVHELTRASRGHFHGRLRVKQDATGEVKLILGHYTVDGQSCTRWYHRHSNLQLQ